VTEINGWMNIADPTANVLFAAGGWDSVTLDAQHGLFDRTTLARSLLALAGRTPRRYVRPHANTAFHVGEALDLGADGVIAPLVNSGAEARRLVDAAWYPPRGARSYGPVLAAHRAGERPYLEAAGDIEVFAMIETRDGLDAVSEIARTPGITGLFIGPNDLGLSLGLGAGGEREEPEMHAAFAAVLSAARAHNKRCGIFCATAAYAARMAAAGFDMVTGGSDTGLLSAAAHAASATARG
jgi:4-hydroxy-2-oxoheptanedioate aldolase